MLIMYQKYCVYNISGLLCIHELFNEIIHTNNKYVQIKASRIRNRNDGQQCVLVIRSVRLRKPVKIENENSNFTV